MDGWFTGGYGLLDLKFDFSKGDLPWPKKFEDLVHAIPDPDEILADASADRARHWSDIGFKLNLSDRPRDRSDLAFDLGYVLSKKSRQMAKIGRAPKDSTVRHPPSHNKASVPQSGPDAYHAPLPLRHTTTEDRMANVIRKKKRTKFRIMVGTADCVQGDQAFNVAAVIHPLPAQ